MDYKVKIKEILKDKTIPKEQREKLEGILLAAEEVEDKRLKEFLCKTFTKQYLCSDKLGKWHGEPVANILAWLEKQCEKPEGKLALESAKEEKVDYSNKVKPKFHEGEWITNGYDTWKIVEVKPLDYILQSQDGNIVDDTISYVDGVSDSFTIQDAKDGDILAGKIDGDSYILIFKQVKEGWVETYGHYYDSVDRFCVPSQLFCRDYQGTFIPATKEQRNLLFQKMKEAGYEWDDKEKKLIKIEASLPSFDEQQGTPVIDIPFDAKDSELQEASYHIPEGFHVEIQGNKVIIKKGEKRLAWNKEDEQIALSIEQVMNCATLLNIVPEKISKVRTWLQSLKERMEGG